MTKLLTYHNISLKILSNVVDKRMEIGRRSWFIFFLFFLQLVGCARKEFIVTNSAGGRYSDISAEARLAEAAESISRSLATLAAIEKAAQPKAKLAPPNNSEYLGLDQLTSIDWSGPVEPLVKRLATVSKYQLKVLGTAPSIPILISIHAKDSSTADVLRDINFQCGTRANIAVYGAQKVIELRYMKP